VKHHHDEGFVNARKSEKLLHELNRFLFVVHSINQVGYTVDHHHMDAAKLAFKLVYALGPFFS
jgi:hypothetical protein